MAVLRAQVGETVTFEVKCRKSTDLPDNGQFLRVNGVNATIKDSAGATVGAPNTTVTWKSRGHYILHWNTTGLSADEYLVAFTVGQGFNSSTGTSDHRAPERVRVQLVEAAL